MSEELLAFLQKKYKGTTVLSSDNIPMLKRLRTNVLGLDVMLGGGLPLGRIVELYGLESGGKSAISLALCKSAIDQGGFAVYIDLERTVTTEQIVRYGIDPEKLIVCRPDSGEEALDFALDSAEGGAKVIIIDSVPMLTPKAIEQKIEADSEYKDVSSVAGLLNRLKTKVIKGIEQHDCCLVFINQIRDKMNSPYGGVDTPGGHALKHMLSVRIQVTHVTKDKEKPGQIVSHLRVEKNKTYTPYLTTSLSIRDGIVDSGDSLVTAAAATNVLVKSGGWYKWGSWLPIPTAKTGESLGNGSQKVWEYLSSNPELCDKIYEEVLSRSLKADE